MGWWKGLARTADQFTFIFTSVALLCGARQTEDLIIICFVLCVRQAKRWQHPPSNKPSWSVVYWLLLGIGRVIIHYLDLGCRFKSEFHGVCWVFGAIFMLFMMFSADFADNQSSQGEQNWQDLYRSVVWLHMTTRVQGLLSQQKIPQAWFIMIHSFECFNKTLRECLVIIKASGINKATL